MTEPAPDPLVDGAPDDGALDDGALDDGALFVGDDGTLAWFAARPATVAAVVVPVAVDVSVQVDVAEPDRVVGWTARSGAALADSLLPPVDPVPEPGLHRRSGPGRLPAGWARFALVLGVDRWLPQPLPAATLTVDLAVAAAGAGLRDDARDRFDLASATLLRLAQEALDGALPPAMRSPLVAAARTAADLLAGTPEADELVDLAQDLEIDVEGADPGVVEDDRAGSSAAPEQGRRLARASERRLGADAVVLVTGRVDPRLVPARILHWAGAEVDEVVGEVADGRVTAHVPLAADVRADDVEVTALRLSVVDERTGMAIATAPLRPGAAGEMTADLPDAPPGVVTSLQVHRAGPVPEFRCGSLDGRRLAVDRLLLDAWSVGRLRVAAGTDVGPAEYDRLDRTVDELEVLAGGLPRPGVNAAPPWSAGVRWASGTPTADDAAARFVPIAALLDAPNPTIGSLAPAEEPLLAEREYVGRRTEEDDR